MGAPIATYDDHRIAMAFSVMGLMTPGVVIKDPSCVSKTCPEFFDLFEGMSAQLAAR
jgi:3-phosphoshikimate 1-carboxyvinyltransferase